MFVHTFTNILVKKLFGNDLLPEIAKNLLTSPNYIYFCVYVVHCVILCNPLCLDTFFILCIVHVLVCCLIMSICFGALCDHVCFRIAAQWYMHICICLYVWLSVFVIGLCLGVLCDCGGFNIQSVDFVNAMIISRSGKLGQLILVMHVIRYKLLNTSCISVLMLSPYGSL